MDGFGDNFVPNGVPPVTTAAVDPAADFLAREQDQLAGLEDPPTGGEAVPAPAPAPSSVPAPVPAPSPAPAPATELPEEDIGASGTVGADTQNSTSPVTQAAGAEDAPAPAVAIPTIEETPPAPDRAVTPVPRVDPEAIRVWREEHQRKLVEKDAAEEEAKETLRTKAQQELTDWYRHHDDQLTNTRQANRCAEKELVADTERPEPGTEWERIAKLCDFNPKTASKSNRDVSRMRSIILHVKQSPPVKA